MTVRVTVPIQNQTEMPLLHSLWCTHDGLSREEFEARICDFVARRGEDPETITYHYGTIEGSPAVNVIWRAEEPLS